MGYYDYSHYFQTMINNQELVMNKQDEFLLCLQVLLVLNAIIFLYVFFRDLLGGGK